jgi:hypothetical protein
LPDVLYGIGSMHTGYGLNTMKLNGLTGLRANGSLALVDPIDNLRYFVTKGW